MDAVAGVLKLAEYTAGSNYISAIFTVHSLQGHDNSQTLANQKSTMQKSLKKAEGDIGLRHRRPLLMSHIKMWENNVYSKDERVAALLMVVSFFWHQRASEVLNIRRSNVNLVGSDFTACTLAITGQKINPKKEIVYRTLYCICHTFDEEYKIVHPCPTHGMAPLMVMCPKTAKTDMLKMNITSSTYAGFFKVFLTRMNVEMFSLDGKAFYGTQCQGRGLPCHGSWWCVLGDYQKVWQVVVRCCPFVCVGCTHPYNKQDLG